MASATRQRSFKLKARLFLLGSSQKSGLIVQLVTYLLLIGLGFVFLYPVIYMLITSFMSADDLINPTVSFIPSRFVLSNYGRAFNVLEFLPSLLKSFMMSVVPAALQTFALAYMTYGIARYKMPLKRLWIVLIVIAYIIPSQVTLVPQYVLYNTVKWIDTPLVSYIPAILGQGIKSSIFILVFYQFYSSYPKAFDEAAAIDGAGPFKIWLRVAIPMVGPAILVTFLFTFIWSWNELDKSSFFFGGKIQTLPMKLQSFVNEYSQLYATNDYSTTNKLNDAIQYAGTVLTISPLVIIYLFLQRYFIEGIERTGLTG